METKSYIVDTSKTISQNLEAMVKLVFPQEMMLKSLEGAIKYDEYFKINDISIEICNSKRNNEYEITRANQVKFGYDPHNKYITNSNRKRHSIIKTVPIIKRAHGSMINIRHLKQVYNELLEIRAKDVNQLQSQNERSEKIRAKLKDVKERFKFPQGPYLSYDLDRDSFQLSMYYLTEEENHQIIHIYNQINIVKVE
jgi:hypothetical protein